MKNTKAERLRETSEEISLSRADSPLTSSSCVTLDKPFLEEQSIVSGPLGDGDEYSSVLSLKALGDADS